MILMLVKLTKQPVDFDVGELVSMLLALDQLHHSTAPNRFPMFSFEKRKQDIEKLIEQGSIFYAEQDTQILGFASVVQKNEKYWIEWLYVAPEFRLKKVATKLCQHIFAHYLEKEVFVSVQAFNHEATKFYQKLFILSSLTFKAKN